MTMNLRNNFSRLAESLLREGKPDSALTVLNKCLEVMPDKTVPYNIMMIRIAELYYMAGRYNETMATMAGVAVDPADSKSADAIVKGNEIVKRLADIYENDLGYYTSLGSTKFFSSVQNEAGQCVAVIRELQRISDRAGQKEIAADLQKRFELAEQKFYSR
jgi:hypothetical protein